MKRNKLFLLGLFVVFAAVLSLSLVSSTFAKYVTTSETAQDSARVAKWGVNVTTSSSAFEREYEADDDTAGITNSVVAAEDVLAPGTEGQLVEATISGTPEVAVAVAVTVDLELGENWKVGDPATEYCPLVFTVNGVEYKKTGTIAELETAVENAIKAALGEGNKEAGTDLAKTLEVTWEWAFAGDDVNDTLLGNAVAVPTIDFSLQISVTQID